VLEGGTPHHVTGARDAGSETARVSVPSPPDRGVELLVTCAVNTYQQAHSTPSSRCSSHSRSREYDAHIDGERVVLEKSAYKPGSVLVEGGGWEALRERVRHVMRPCTLLQLHLIVANQIPDEIPAHIDVPRELPVHRVLGNVNAGCIIFPDLRR